jgi:hypothetical protein
MNVIYRRVRLGLSAAAAAGAFLLRSWVGAPEMDYLGGLR